MDAAVYRFKKSLLFIFIEFIVPILNTPARSSDPAVPSSVNSEAAYSINSNWESFKRLKKSVDVKAFTLRDVDGANRDLNNDLMICI